MMLAGQRPAGNCSEFVTSSSWSVCHVLSDLPENHLAGDRGHVAVGQPVEVQMDLWAGADGGPP